MDKRTRYSPEVRERTVRLVQEHRAEYGSQWAAIQSIAAKVGCTAETFRHHIRKPTMAPTHTCSARRAGNP